jgi:hypothetical protein
MKAYIGYHTGSRNEKKKNRGIEDLLKKYYSRSDDVFKNEGVREWV